MAGRYWSLELPLSSGRSFAWPLALLALCGALAACSPAPIQTAPTAAPPPKASEGTQAQPRPEVGLNVGNLAPDFSLTTLDGRPLTGAELEAQDKPYVLFFFATW